MRKIYLLIPAIIMVICSAATTMFQSANGHIANQQQNSNLVLDSTVLGSKTIISNLDVPWEITWGPDNWIWMDEQKGILSKVNPKTGQKKILLKLTDVYKKKSYGLLGFAIHTDFKNMPYVYIDYTYLKPAALKDTSLRDSSILSKIVRYTYRNDTLINPVVIFKDIPGNTYHNGCRMIITPDRKLIFTTGDAGHSKQAQDINRVNGKILRINLDGSIPDDNPFKGNPVWTYGHRNAEGLAFAPDGTLYSSENGEANDDELNIITKGGNYGWPNVEGFCNTPQEKAFCANRTITEPLIAWTPTIAPSGIDYYKYTKIPEWQNTILMGTLKGNSLRALKLSKDGKAVADDKVYFDHVYGRIRDICISPQGDVYLSTSNRDWNPAEGFPKPGDDKIIKLYKIKTLAHTAQTNITRVKKPEIKKTVGGVALYTNYCASCHKLNGLGLKGTFPPLANTEIVAGGKTELIKTVLTGITGALKVKGQVYNQEMPSFKFMNDNELATVLTYVRSNFGNRYPAITVTEVSKTRKDTN